MFPRHHPWHRYKRARSRRFQQQTNGLSPHCGAPPFLGETHVQMPQLAATHMAGRHRNVASPRGPSLGTRLRTRTLAAEEINLSKSSAAVFQVSRIWFLRPTRLEDTGLHLSSIACSLSPNASHGAVRARCGWHDSSIKIAVHSFQSLLLRFSSR